MNGGGLVGAAARPPVGAGTRAPSVLRRAGVRARSPPVPARAQLHQDRLPRSARCLATTAANYPPCDPDRARGQHCSSSSGLEPLPNPQPPSRSSTAGAPWEAAPRKATPRTDTRGERAPSRRTSSEATAGTGLGTTALGTRSVPVADAPSAPLTSPPAYVGHPHRRTTNLNQSPSP